MTESRGSFSLIFLPIPLTDHPSPQHQGTATTTTPAGTTTTKAAAADDDDD